MSAAEKSCVPPLCGLCVPCGFEAVRREKVPVIAFLRSHSVRIKGERTSALGKKVRSLEQRGEVFWGKDLLRSAFGCMTMSGRNQNRIHLKRWRRPVGQCPIVQLKDAQSSAVGRSSFKVCDARRSPCATSHLQLDDAQSSVRGSSCVRAGVALLPSGWDGSISAGRDDRLSLSRLLTIPLFHYSTIPPFHHSRKWLSCAGRRE